MKDKDIVSLYKKSATETPSKELDKQILDLAKANSKKSFQYRPYLALAASIGLVTLLAPWRWYESTQQALPDIEPVQLQMAPSDRIRSESLSPARERAKMHLQENKSVESEPLQARRVIPSDSTKASKGLEALKDIEQLVQSGDKEQAKQKLIALLKEQPELQSQLSEELSQLLADAP